MCEHEAFKCQANIGRLSTEEGGPITHFCADITVECVQCGEKFEFIGLKRGVSCYEPTVNFDQTCLHAPVMPKGMKPPAGLPCFFVERVKPPTVLEYEAKVRELLSSIIIPPAEPDITH